PSLFGVWLDPTESAPPLSAANLCAVTAAAQRSRLFPHSFAASDATRAAQCLGMGQPGETAPLSYCHPAFRSRCRGDAGDIRLEWASNRKPISPPKPLRART